jgi:hypothetical protein
MINECGGTAAVKTGRGNSVPLCAPQIPHYLRSNLVRCGWKTAANRLSYGMPLFWLRAGRLKGRSSSPVGARSFISPCRPDLLWGPPSLLWNGYGGALSHVREADYSPSTSAEVNKTWIYTSTPTYVFMP